MNYTYDNNSGFKRKTNNILLISFYAIIAILISIFIINQFNSSKSFYIDNKDIKLALGDNYQLILKSDNKPYTNNGNITWESSDDSVAIVDQNGVVTGLGKGSAEITARSNSGKLSTIYIEVYGEEETQTTISLNKNEIELDIGSSFELIADIETNDPSNTVVNWLSNNDSVAEVTNGIVTAKKSGKAVIVAKLKDGTNASCTVKVKEEQQDLSSISVNNNNINANIGDSFTITPIINNPNNEITSLKWISSDNSIATVNDAGLINILGDGTVTITILANNGKSTTITITVNKVTINPTNIALDKTNLELNIGDTYTLNYSIEPANADKIVIWSSNNVGVATVDNGYIVAQNTGTAIISAALKNGKTATCVVTVKDKNINNFTIDKTYVSLKVNQTDKLTTYGGTDVTWSTSNNNIVTVDNGVIKAIAPGTATITAKSSDGRTVSCNVEVKNNIIIKNIIVLNTNTKELKVGEEFTLIATSIPQNKIESNVVWSSSNENVATVDNGKIIAKAEGTTIIKAIGENNIATCTIRVINNKVEATAISLDKTDINMDVGTTMKVNVIFNPVNSSNKKITWTSSDNSIASVKDGTISAKKEGKVTIIATSNNGLKAQANVTVNSKAAIKVKTVNLSQKNVTMYIGESITLNAAISPNNATNKTITWSTSNSNIATVDNGYIVANKAGTVTITATSSNGVKDTCTIIVKDKNTPIKSIVINSKEKMYVGRTLKLNAIILPANATNKTITWTSSDNSVATVDASGNVTALKVGTVIITAKTENNLKAVCKITIKNKTVAVKNISLNQTNATMSTGDNLSLAVTFTPNNATNKTITWTSSDDNIATVNNGNVIAKKDGKVTITAKTYNGKTATCTIVINNNIINVSSISLNKTTANMKVDESLSLKASISPTNATNKNISWTSSNTKIATVDTNGKVTTKAAGSVVITATSSNGKQATCVITVTNKVINPNSISLNNTKANMNVGDKITLKANISPTNATNKNISWTSSNSDIATIDKNGNVKAKKTGTVTITATTNNGKQATCKITITNKTINVTSISLNKTKLSMYVGNTATLSATIKPNNASSKKITWSSNNTSVATVDKNGNVKALKKGSATITATSSNGMKATCVVNVTNSTINVTGITISNPQINIGVGKKSTVLATIEPANATNKTITWSTSDSSIVSVDKKGNIKGKKAGTATITATTNNGKTAQATVVVSNSNVTVINSTYTTIIANYNVKDYGAKGDGVTDDTQAFKNALADATNCANQPSCTGYTVYVPKGTYRITDSLELGPVVGLVGELKEGTANGTILAIDFGEGTTDINRSAIKMGPQAAIINIAFWYPKQTINNNGYAIAYPPTVLDVGPESLTIDNVNFINSYMAMDFASYRYNNSIQHVYNVYGSPFHGLLNDFNLDTIRITNMNFSPKYWANSGLSNSPTQAALQTALKAGGVGMTLERVDWYLISGVNIDGYNVGIRLRDSTPKRYSSDDVDRNSEGEFYDINITNTQIPLLIESARHLVISNSKLVSSSQNSAAIEIFRSENISINSSEISGKNSITNRGDGNISIVDSKVTGAINRPSGAGKITFVNNSLKNTLYDNVNANTATRKPAKVNYNKRVTTKPKSTNIIVMDGKNTDVTAQLKNALNTLSSTGGIVYFPPGNYIISDHIEVPSGVEIRGTTPWFHNWLQIRPDGTGFDYVTRITANINNQILFSLNSNSGLNGLTIIYGGNFPNQQPFAIQGKGNNVYVMNISLPNAWNGLDFATYKCDNHYISNVWGEVFELGIKIGGGSSNGIVKNNHLVINCLVRNDTEDWRRKWEYIVKHKISFEVGNSTNELLIGNLAYNAYVGYSIINGAKGFNIIGNGTDSSGKYGIYVSGNVDGYIVNPLLVTMGTKLWCHSDGVCFDSNMNPSERQYIMTDSSFKGGLTIVNPLAWGNQEATAYDLNGTGDIHIYSGSIDAAKSTVIKNSNSSLAIIGLLIEVKDGTIIEYRNGAKNSILMGNICKNRNCSSAIANNGKTNLGINENGIR